MVIPDTTDFAYKELWDPIIDGSIPSHRRTQSLTLTSRAAVSTWLVSRHCPDAQLSVVVAQPRSTMEESVVYGDSARFTFDDYFERGYRMRRKTEARKSRDARQRQGHRHSGYSLTDPDARTKGFRRQGTLQRVPRRIRPLLWISVADEISFPRRGNAASRPWSSEIA